MKFNWGTGIVLALLIMVSGMIYLVSIAVRQDFDLVDKDYYQKSVNYQQHIEKVRNTESLAEKIRFEQTTDSLKILFPNLGESKDYKGEIHFYSPVAEKRDTSVTVKPDTGYAQRIAMKKMRNGRYEVKIDWSVNKTEYYQEEAITVTSDQSQ
ncbi:MAG: FixH family protein [Prolixibacteraceae bacterium]|jgi:hypothetical protein